MAIVIPSGAVTLWQNGMDAFLADDFATVGTLVFPPTLVEDTNLPTEGGQDNFGLSGRPAPFSNIGGNSISSGSQYKEVRQTENINMRVYWVGTGGTATGVGKILEKAGIVLPAGDIVVKTFLTQMEPIMNSIALTFENDPILLAQKQYSFTLQGEPLPIGFNYNRYCLSSWKRGQSG